MRSRQLRWLVPAGILGMLLLGAAGTPGRAGMRAQTTGLIDGPCQGSVTMAANGVTYSSSTLSPDQVIAIPQASSYHWEGGELGHTPGAPDGPARPMHGGIWIETPVGKAALYLWNNGYPLHYGFPHRTSIHYANEGVAQYHFPAVLDNIKLRLTGYQIDSGRETCSGSATVEIKGSSPFANPIAIGSAAGLVIVGTLLYFAGRPVYSFERAEFYLGKEYNL